MVTSLLCVPDSGEMNALAVLCVCAPPAKHVLELILAHSGPLASITCSAKAVACRVGVFQGTRAVHGRPQ